MCCWCAGAAGSPGPVWAPAPGPCSLDLPQSHEVDQRHRPKSVSFSYNRNIRIDLDSVLTVSILGPIDWCILCLHPDRGGWVKLRQVACLPLLFLNKSENLLCLAKHSVSMSHCPGVCWQSPWQGSPWCYAGSGPLLWCRCHGQGPGNPQPQTHAPSAPIWGDEGSRHPCQVISLALSFMVLSSLAIVISGMFCWGSVHSSELN